MALSRIHGADPPPLPYLVLPYTHLTRSENLRPPQKVEGKDSKWRKDGLEEEKTGNLPIHQDQTLQQVN